ncbi:glycosyltransferase [Glaciecola sp. XM2]|uniref:MJ1255/VC2487 family glycosyltransferase n=1 Tax=Glaciecola sp. XM2 TaxID=1914931 RepID=UPI001BDF6A68|nr:MJ1255/VC2487 family glycosyltransferase [Glaciecola sp. XM2]MBT1451729.1 glycosyltransferase [Glaciecola sp. XM2]
MKILYGIQGTGNGHITRARHLARGFAKRDDIQVDYMFSGRPANQYFDMQTFGAFDVARGLTFITENGRIRHRKTLLSNNLFTLAKDISQQHIKSYDLVLNDFEPVTAWAAKLAGVPSLSVSHQAAFLHHVPKHKENPLDRAITQWFAPTKYSLGTHWYHFGCQIIPPFVSPELSLQRTNSSLTSSGKVLVYLPFENPERIREQLHVLSDQNFICYHPTVKHIEVDKNITWHPPSTTQFKDALTKSVGVISNCGFELSTECLSLGKPLLVKPLHRQYEQQSNAFTLHKLGLCEVMYEVNAEEIDDWLQNKKSVSIQYPSDCSDFIDWLATGNWTSPESICKRLWQQVKFPDHVKVKLNDLSVFAN